MPQKPTVLIVMPYYRPGFKAGGPIKSVVNLTEALGDEFDFKVLTGCSEMGEQEPLPGIEPNQWQPCGKASVYYSLDGPSMRKEFRYQMSSKLCELAYFQSMFNKDYTLVPLLIRLTSSTKRQVPVVVFPRGQFSEGALAQGTRKKQLFLNLFRLLPMGKKFFFQATNADEVEEIKRQLKFKGPIFIAPNVPNKISQSNSRIPKANNSIRLVFLSRVSPKKNLEYALERLTEMPPDIEVSFDIYGPIEDEGYWKSCLTVIERCSSNVKVAHCGSILPDEVLSTLQKYDVFFFPTLGENYGHVIVEAMSSGLALLISDRTPWLNLEDVGIGQALPLSQPEQFSAAIEKYARMTEDKMLVIRNDVLKYVSQLTSSQVAIAANRDMLNEIAGSSN